MTTERVIHASIFMLLLIGFSVLISWASYNYLQSNLVLVIGSIPLGWGIILLAMYLSFKRLGWNWWS
ncbi:MAG: hypothetical protein ABSA79_06220 [Candidatus Bathyarchaeia archaeon]|jgi:TRAP-type C4-dicarboxylate transport system permease small subunit